MAIRPVFVVDKSKKDFVIEKEIEFKWYSGFSKSQKQKSIQSLHEKFLLDNPERKVLEISSKSKDSMGIRLSAFNLTIMNTIEKQRIPVECVFQASKVFKEGGPYLDILKKSSLEAKKDMRLRESGELVCFSYENKKWGLNPKSYFYDWLYINAVYQDKELSEEILQYDAFTDIEFNPKKSINCQARSAALYVSLYNRNLLNDFLSDENKYRLYFENRGELFSNNDEEYRQINLFE